MKDVALFGGILLLLLSAIILATIDSRALYVDVVVFLTVGCVAYALRNRF
jgi:hypothetical protein